MIKKKSGSDQTKPLIQTLKNLYESSLNLQMKELQELLQVEKIVNFSLSTNYVTNKNKSDQKITVRQAEQKKQINVQKIGQKLEQLIDTLQPVPSKPKQINQQPVIIEKKPPIPTINRSNDPNAKLTVTKYVAPRNKNEVTGKVTDTKLKTSVTKINSSVQKKQIQKQPQIQPVTQSNSVNLDHDANSISQYKALRQANKQTVLQSFSKPLQVLVQQVKQNKKPSNSQNSSNSSKKPDLTKLLQQYNQQQLGHNQLEQKRRKLFIKKFNNLSFSLNKNNCNYEVSNSVEKRLWKQYEAIFEFNELLEQVEAKLAEFQQKNKEELRIDPKQVYKQQFKLDIMRNELSKITDSTQVKVPQKLHLTFQPLNQKQSKPLKNSGDYEKPEISPFYQSLTELLQHIKQSQSLTSKQLSWLRILFQISLQDGSRTPLIVQQQEFQDWRQSYTE